MDLKISSSAFGYEGGMPELYTCKGKNISPPLQWGEPPAGTQSFVLVMTDPSVPLVSWVHWVVFNLPADVRLLEEGVAVLPAGAQPGKNGWRRKDYGGPCPPGGARHRYVFKLYALDTRLDLPDGVNKRKLEKTMQGHVLAQGELVGVYKE